jgi:uncharacterized membrane protein (DUF4010 family)
MVLALGTVAGLGELALASGATAVIVLALMEKERLHALVKHIGERELRSALQFAVMSLVILPLLPDTSFAGVQPRALWIMVLLFTGLNFAGYLAQRALGPQRGYIAAGMIGGIISSTSVALLFSRRSRTEPAVSTPLALGIIGACTVLLLRLAVVTSILDESVAAALLPYLVPPLILGGVIVAIAISRDHPRPSGEPADGSQNPLRLASALQMTVAFQLSLWAVAYVREHWGRMELLGSAALLGLTDMDALTVSMTRLGATGQAELAALAIAVGVVANTGLKLALALILGSPALRRIAGLGLAALGAASVAGIVFMNR